MESKIQAMHVTEASVESSGSAVEWGALAAGALGAVGVSNVTDQARRAVAFSLYSSLPFSLYSSLPLAISAFIASIAGMEGGRHRDK